MKAFSLGGNVGKPLYLTPYIEAGRLKEGQQASVVPPLLDNIVSYSGYFTVNKNAGSNIFFWFFPCEQDPVNAPLALWLQGGPGASSIFAIFEENGPFRLLGNLKIGRKSHYWTQKMNVIYIDQPVGTGYSYTEKDSGYPNNEDEVARDLVETLKQFFQIFPEYRKNSFFITGESYAGKYIPALGYATHQYNIKSEIKINLKGVAIGNGWVDPLNMIDYANLLYGLSFIDLKTKNEFQEIENNIKTMIKNKKYMEAFWALDKYFDGDLTPYPTLIHNVTGITNYYNFIHALQSDSDNKLINYLNQSKVRKSMHVGNLTFNDQNNKVEDHLMIDELLSVVPKLEVLLDNYRVLLYNGQLDLICAYPLTMNYVRKMKWKDAEEYAKATRKQWFVGEELAGYYKSAGNFTEVSPV